MLALALPGACADGAAESERTTTVDTRPDRPIVRDGDFYAVVTNEMEVQFIVRARLVEG